MARFMVSMPEDMLNKLDRQAQAEDRSRSELLREAVRRYLSVSAQAENAPVAKKGLHKKSGKKALERHLLDKGLVQGRCLGLDTILGPVKGPVNMQKVLKVGRKLTGLSREIVEARKDRV